MSAGSVSAARLPQESGQRLRSRAGWRWLASPAALGAVVGLALGALALGPGLAWGFLLSYDMVFVPGPPFSAALLGFTGGPARAVPSDLVITVAARLLPADLVQKTVLLLIFVMACSGAAALLAAGWRSVTGRPAPVLGCLVCGVFYSWNPFVAERLLIGQWAFLLGYAGLPWVLREVCTGPVRIRPARLLLMLAPAAVGGFAAMAVTGLAVIPAAVARGGRPERTGQPVTATAMLAPSERARRLLTVVAALALLSLPWLIPSVVVGVHTSPAGVDLFAARADTPFGRIGSLVALSGIWNAQTVPRGYGGAAEFCWLLVVACALAGYLLRARVQRMWPGLGLAGLVGLAIAVIGLTSPTRAALRDLVAAWPGFAVLRDGQQFVAALALTEAIGLGVVAAWVLQRSAARVPAGHGPPRRSVRPRTEPAAVVLAVLAILAPLVLLPGLAWGLAGRLGPAQYPADWLAARRLIDGSRQPGSVLLLPWGAYRRYPWNNHGAAVYDPWTKLLSREVIANDGLQVGHRTLPQESPASIRLAGIILAAGSLTAPLRSAGVRYVVVDAGPLLHAPIASLATAARLPGAQLVQASPDLVVFLLPWPH